MIHSFSQTNEWFDDYTVFAKVFGVEPHLNTFHSAGKRNGTNLFLDWVRGDEKFLTMEPPASSNRGIVNARDCDSCGHHEIGITAVTGEFVHLKSGTKVFGGD